jgi:hypothetical protein
MQVGEGKGRVFSSATLILLLPFFLLHRRGEDIRYILDGEEKKERNKEKNALC